MEVDFYGQVDKNVAVKWSTPSLQGDTTERKSWEMGSLQVGAVSLMWSAYKDNEC